MGQRFVQLDEDTFVAAHHVTRIRYMPRTRREAEGRTVVRSGMSTWESVWLPADDARTEFNRIVRQIRCCEMPD